MTNISHPLKSICLVRQMERTTTVRRISFKDLVSRSCQKPVDLHSLSENLDETELDEAVKSTMVGLCFNLSCKTVAVEKAEIIEAELTNLVRQQTKKNMIPVELDQGRQLDHNKHIIEETVFSRVSLRLLQYPSDWNCDHEFSGKLGNDVAVQRRELRKRQELRSGRLNEIRDCIHDSLAYIRDKMHYDNDAQKLVSCKCTSSPSHITWKHVKEGGFHFEDGKIVESDNTSDNNASPDPAASE